MGLQPFSALGPPFGSSRHPGRAPGVLAEGGALCLVFLSCKAISVLWLAFLGWPVACRGAGVRPIGHVLNPPLGDSFNKRLFFEILI